VVTVTHGTVTTVTGVDMRFYDRISELAEMERIRSLSVKGHSRLTVVTGRRRIGKTSLIMEAAPDAGYLFVSRKNEANLCQDWIPLIAKTLDTFVPEIRTVRELFQYLMSLARDRAFTLVIDEFQEFSTVNPSVFSEMQNIWDQYRDKTHMNLIISGSVYSLMQKIFHDAKEPLFGRADNIIKLSAFDTDTLKAILSDYYPKWTNDDLLGLFSFSGGIPKYVELFCDNKSLSVSGMIKFMIRENSSFIDEGKYLLIEEFGKDYGLYFSILSAISGGINTQSGIEAAVGNKSIGGHLKRLVDDYNIIARLRPILAKDGTQAVRYEIIDNFLKFWFNYFDRYRSMVEIKNFSALQTIVKKNYETYTGKMLEAYFRQRFAESQKYKLIGSWWEPKGSQNEIDIVALEVGRNKAVAVEVKRKKKNYNPAVLEAKIDHLKNKVLPQYEIAMLGLSLEDM
jgi:AAA+ ATPase superfamily predicted ATPase